MFLTGIFLLPTFVVSAEEAPEMAADPVVSAVSAFEVDKVSENSGGSHYEPISKREPLKEEIPVTQNEDGTYTIHTNDVDPSLGVVSATNVGGEWDYDEEGNVVVNEINDKSTVTVGEDWTSRYYQYDYVYNVDGDAPSAGAYIEKAGMEGVAEARTAAALKGDDVSNAANYTTELKNGQLVDVTLDEVGIAPSAPEGYYYNGTMTMQYVEGAAADWIYYSKEGVNQENWDSAEEYHLAVDAETGEVSGDGVALTRNQYFTVVYQYYKYHNMILIAEEGSQEAKVLEGLKYGEEVPISANFVKDGYIFKGWMDEEGNFYGIEDVLKMPYMDVTLCGIWEVAPVEPEPEVDPNPEPEPEPEVIPTPEPTPTSVSVETVAEVSVVSEPEVEVVEIEEEEVPMAGDVVIPKTPKTGDHGNLTLPLLLGLLLIGGGLCVYARRNWC